MQSNPNKSQAEPALSKPANAKPPDIAFASVPDTLGTLRVNPETGLARAEVDVRRKQKGYNEVAEKKGRPLLVFLCKFWGLSAWMLVMIMILSAILGKYSDLFVVSALLVVNAGLSFMQVRRAAGVVEALRPGDIVRVRPGDIISADCASRCCLALLAVLPRARGSSATSYGAPPT